MKLTTLLTLAAGCAALPLLLNAPAHAQWVAGQPMAVQGSLLSISSPANKGTGGGGTTIVGTTITALSNSSGSSNGASSDYEYGDQWQVTYSWSGSGTPTYPFTVSVQEQVTGKGGGSSPASGNASSSAQGADTNRNNGSNPAALGDSCAVGGPSYTAGYSKTPAATNVLLPMTDGANPVMVVTLAAKSGGQCIQTPPGTTANWGSYNMQSNAQVTLGNPH